VPVEIKYQNHIVPGDLKGLHKFMKMFGSGKGIVVTKNLFESRVFEDKKIMFIPAWLYLLVK